MNQGSRFYIYHRFALSVFLISRYFPRFTRSRACLEGERARYPFVSRNPVIQSVGSEAFSLAYHGCVMLNREAGNGDDDEEERRENKEEETAGSCVHLGSTRRKRRKGGREKDEESERTDCSNVASPSHR